jgi:hypothetical protein
VFHTYGIQCILLAKARPIDQKMDGAMRYFNTLGDDLESYYLD